MNENIFIYLRIPRSIAAVFAGASLSVCGLVLQSYFRNPIVEAGLIGISSGAAFGASLYFVFGFGMGSALGNLTLSALAFGGALLSMLLIFLFSGIGKRNASDALPILLSGIAFNALFTSGIGYLSYFSRDPQARSITFWNLGSLSGADYQNSLLMGICTLVFILLMLGKAHAFDLLALGYDNAQLLGLNVRALQRLVFLLCTLMIAIITAYTGVIAFVGLVVPHITRLMGFRKHKIMIIQTAILGAIFMLCSDILARTLIAPAELPIGIITAITGVPVFLILRSRLFNLER